MCVGDTESPRPFQKFGHTVDLLGFCDEARKKKKKKKEPGKPCNCPDSMVLLLRQNKRSGHNSTRKAHLP